MGNEENSSYSELLFLILKFEYEMIQDEIKKNVKIADTIKVVMIPTAVAAIGWVATAENSMKACELLAVGLASVSMILLVWGISKRMHAINTVFLIDRRKLKDIFDRFMIIQCVSDEI